MPSEEAAQLIMFKYAKTKAEKEREEHIEERKSSLKSKEVIYMQEVLQILLHIYIFVLPQSDNMR